jgi:hypothetical protein
MATSVKKVIEAFDELYGALIDPEFCKSLHMDKWSERKLAPLVRTFLLGGSATATCRRKLRVVSQVR